MKSVLIFIDYFGAWPEWFPVFLASCAANPTIHWHFHTDCAIPIWCPRNVVFFPTTFEEYKQRVSDTLEIPFAAAMPYKVCDLRPAFGLLHAAEIAGYDYWGYGDIDVVYGDIRRFYDDAVLCHNVISTHKWTLSGHLALIKAERWLAEAFQQVPGWRELLASREPRRFDEDHFGKLFLKPPRGVPRRLRPRYWLNNYFREQYTTIMTPSRWLDGRRDHPLTWFWRNGSLTNDRDGARQFIYLHFMNMKSARHLDWASYPGGAPWEKLPRLMHLQPTEIGRGVRIDRTGFHSLSGGL